MPRTVYSALGTQRQPLATDNDLAQQHLRNLAIQAAEQQIRQQRMQPDMDAGPKAGVAPWRNDPANAPTIIGPDNREDEAFARELARRAADRQDAMASGAAQVQGRAVDDALAMTGGSTTEERISGQDTHWQGRAAREFQTPEAIRARQLQDEARTRGYTVADRDVLLKEAQAKRDAEAEAGDYDRVAAVAKAMADAGDPRAAEIIKWLMAHDPTQRAKTPGLQAGIPPGLMLKLPVQKSDGVIPGASINSMPRYPNPGRVLPF